jgi:flagellar basal-body rod protein FlgB
MSESAIAITVASKALDGLYLRMAAIAQNLANASSAGYQPIAVDFEGALAAASAKGDGAVEALHFEFTAARPYGANEDRRVDLMIADAAQTAMRYSALVEMTSRRLSLGEIAIGAQG